MSQHVVRGRRRVVGEGGEVTAPSWSLRALNDGVGGGGGEAFTVKKREVTRTSLLAHDAHAIAEPDGYERIFRFSRARARSVLRGVPAWLVGWSKHTNSLGCTPWAQRLIWTRQTNGPLLIQLVTLTSARKAKVCMHAFLRMSVRARLKDFNITHKPL